MQKNIAVLPGDGIGPEVTREAIKILLGMGKRLGIKMKITEDLIGGASLDTQGVPIAQKTLDHCEQADAVFLGAVGGPQWDDLPKEKKPETGLLQIRKHLDLFTNLRPIRVFPSLVDASTLKREVVEGIDILIVRELTSGIYFGQPKYIRTEGSEEHGVDTMEYRTSEIQRITHVAFQLARQRKRKVISVDKANVLMTSQLWRKVVNQVRKEYPDIALEHMLVDNCAMQLIRNPGRFDVLLTCNMFGDILSDEASMLAGSLGLLSSASLGKKVGLYEPAHGSAPDIAGKNLANPLAAIGSVALMFRYSFHMENAAQTIEGAIQDVLDAGYRTKDIYSPNAHCVGTSEMGDLVLNRIITA